MVNQLALELAKTECLPDPSTDEKPYSRLSLLSVKSILLATQTDLEFILESGFHLVRVGRINTIFH